MGDRTINHHKLLDLAEAIETFVNDGAKIVLGAALENAIPFAATHELIRQGRRELHMIAPISDISTDMLIGAGCVTEITGAWVGNVSGGMGHNFRRAAEHCQPHSIKINDYSNFSIGMAFFAGAYGLPYVPVKSILGSDIIKSNKDIRLAKDPYSGGPVALVPALKPDVAFLVVQRSDHYGNSHSWGSTGLTQEASIAANCIIVLADDDASVLHPAEPVGHRALSHADALGDLALAVACIFEQRAENGPVRGVEVVHQPRSCGGHHERFDTSEVRSTSKL